ncbi:MAG: J domain-containing protein [Balneolales bacterium]|nr:J domain-containing protein [Balneolales bacterium]
MSTKDYYGILGVKPGTDTKEIRRSYIRISRIIHPDRFDQNKQPEDWEHANQMLRDVNEAWAVLKDPDKKLLYDMQHGYGQSEATSNYQSYDSQAEEQSSSYTQEDDSHSYYDPGPDPTKNLQSGYRHFSDLPESIRQNLLRRENGTLTDHYYVETEQPTGYYLRAAILLAWTTFLIFASMGQQWNFGVLLFFFGLNMWTFWFFSRQLLWLYKWNKSTLSCRLYITPLYIIETYHDMVRWWPVTGIKNIQITRGNGYYNRDNAVLNLHYEDVVARFHVSPLQLARNCVHALQQFQNKVYAALSSYRYEYVKNRDEFSGISSTHPPSDSRLRFYTTLSPMLLGLLFFGFIFMNNHGNEPQIGNRLISQMLPHNGSKILFFKDDAIAPLELLATTDRNFLVRIINSDNRLPAMTVFVRAGRQLHLRLPDGDYNIRYTAGNSWFGPDHKFGPNGQFFEESQTFTFSSENDTLFGHFIRLGDPERIRSGEIRQISEDTFSR